MKNFKFRWFKFKFNKKKYVNYNREHVFQYQIENKVWFNIKNLRIKRFIKRLFNKNENFFEIIIVINSHVYRLKLFDNWKCYDVFNVHFLYDNVDNSLLEQAFSIFLSINNNDHDDLYEIIRINNFRSFDDELNYLII